MPASNQEQMSFGKTVKGLGKNKPLIAILIASLINYDDNHVNWCG